jgi:hypothetical protein
MFARDMPFSKKANTINTAQQITAETNVSEN